MTTVRVSLGAFAAKALTRKLGSGSESTSPDFASAIRFYLGEKSPDAPGWRYPEFLRDRAPTDPVELELSVEDRLWSALENEARNQGVPAERLLEHATLYYAAGADAGRVTKRILDDFELEGGERD